MPSTVQENDEPLDGDRRDLVTPVVLLVTGVAGVVLGVLARRSFEAGVGTAMIVIAMHMLLDAGGAA